MPDGNGGFSWDNGVRLYYANLAANFSTQPSEAAFKGFEAIAVSRMDDPTAESVGNKDNWMSPVIVSRQNSALFSDHEQIWADNAASSSYFGNVYVCYVAFRSQEISPYSLPGPVKLARSTDGGETWSDTQLSPATNNIQGFGRQDCGVSTDSHGTVYVFWQGGNPKSRQNTIYLTRSFDGGKTFERPRGIATFDQCGLFDPVAGTTVDGILGARDGTFPSLDIANGTPSGDIATDRIVVTFCNGPTPTSTSDPNERAMVMDSTNGGETFSTPVQASPPGDRPDFPAVAISPNGQDVYLVYDNFMQPYQLDTTNPRDMQGVVRHAEFSDLSSWADLYRGATGDARASSANSLSAESLGDYNNASATNGHVVAVWNDASNAADCPDVDAYRASLLSNNPIDKPAPQQDCPATFGNTDIFSGTFAAP